MTEKKVLLGLSGGADSTYAAKRLAELGYTVEAAVLVMHDHTEVGAAETSARELGLKLHIIDCKDAFRATVVENFLNEYTATRTPNPCIICNRDVKFRFLCDFAREHGFDRIATGHYAKVVRVGQGAAARYAVARSEDTSKDQTYMLWRLSQEQLSMLLLPLSDVKKDDVRGALRRDGLAAADRGDSQEICFIPEGDHAAFVEMHRGVSPRGNFVDRAGRVLGTHEGLVRYTVGQRKGLGVALGARAFVTEMDPVTNTIVLDTSPRASREVEISGMVFSGMEPPEATLRRRLHVKLRYRSPLASAEVVFSSEGTARILLDEPQRSVAPGQSAVLYDGDTVVAGGFIDRAD